jgi:hypothetical protein
MKSTQSIKNKMLWCFAAICFAACTNQMEPAKNAIDNINATMSAVSADAQKYVPDQWAAAQSKVAELSAAYEMKDYAAVLTKAPAVLAEAKGLAGAANAKRDEVLKAIGDEWRSLEASIPQSVAAVQGRVDELSKARRAPKGIDIAAAKSGLNDAKSDWDAAQTTFKSGDATDAVNKAKDAKGKVESAAAALKLNLSSSLARTEEGLRPA